MKERCPTITIPQETETFEVFKKDAMLAGFYMYDTPTPIVFEEIPEVKAFLWEKE